MNTLFNILFIISLIGIAVGCSAADAAHGCCGTFGTIDDEKEIAQLNKISAYIGIPSIVCLFFLIFSHQYFDVTLLGLF